MISDILLYKNLWFIRIFNTLRAGVRYIRTSITA